MENDVTDTLSMLVQWFEEAEEATHDARGLAERDKDYYDGKQYTAKEIEILRKRGQPDNVFNMVGPKIDFVLGLENQQRTDPKAFPRNPEQDEQAAHAATDALRYIKDKEDLDQAFSGNWEDILTWGLTGIEIHAVDKRSGAREIEATLWQADQLFYDPHSRRHDFADARYYGGVKWMDFARAKHKWPNAADKLEVMVNDELSDGFEDKPSHKTWVKPGTRKRVRIVNIHWEDKGDWFWAIYTKGGILASGKSPYLNEDQESEPAMIMQSGYVDRDNNRYGAIRRLIGPQDEVNKRRSKLLHLLTVNQIIFEKGAVDNINEAKQQLARADGAVEVNRGLRFDVRDPVTQATGQQALLQDAQAAIERTGPNAALQGKQGQEASGRAIIASQQGGIVELSVLTDRHRNLKKRVYRAIWNRIRQFWDEERWVRVTDNEDNVRFVGFNRPVTAGEALLKEAVQSGIPEEEAQAQIEQMAQDPLRAQQLAQVVGTENVPADMDMDIIIEEAPDTVTIQQEQFDMLANVIGTGLPWGDPRLRFLVQASQLRNKKELIENMDNLEQQSPEQQLLNQVQVEKEVAELEKTQAETENKRADSVKKMAEIDVMDDGQVNGSIGQA